MSRKERSNRPLVSDSEREKLMRRDGKGNATDNATLLADIDSLGAEAVSALRKFLGSAETTTADISRAKVAASAFSGWTRVKATESQRESNFISLARELATDAAQFNAFVKMGMPNAPIVKALERSKA
jgi:hypothetical protein